MAVTAKIDSVIYNVRESVTAIDVSYTIYANSKIIVASQQIIVDNLLLSSDLVSGVIDDQVRRKVDEVMTETGARAS